MPYHFNSCSVLMFYESDSFLMKGEDDAQAQVKLVDCTHVLDGNGVIDHNFLDGFCSFISFIQDILESSDNSDETNTSLSENGLRIIRVSPLTRYNRTKPNQTIVLYFLFDEFSRKVC
ncbi:hypothetical protein Bca52824_070598 [Brassica carinata]|uniref:Uncharacterized protein n=1 Tax=Brassica carinata TaxID=52824 RepID=A0A8X7U375_BRACI|nr:hypothetical protein Bca52824_070598 [Brassica carinata]